MTWTFKFKLMNFNEECFSWWCSSELFMSVCVCACETVCATGPDALIVGLGFVSGFHHSVTLVSVWVSARPENRGVKRQKTGRGETRHPAQRCNTSGPFSPLWGRLWLEKDFFFLFSILVILNECNDLWCGSQSIWHCVILSNIFTKSICGYFFFFKRPIWL